MKLTFLWTKGEIEEKWPKHRYHASLLIEHRNQRLLIDYGELHKKTLKEINPNAVLITHAHPDHYIWTIKDEKTDIPIYATQETFTYGRYKPGNWKMISPGRGFTIWKISILPYQVIHAIRCPAIGFKITIGSKTFIYNPDLIDIIGKEKILKGIDRYIGDGSCVTANLVRKRWEQLFGHTRIPTQIHRCEKKGIRHMIFTHLGKESIRKESLLKEDHPEVIIAYDGMSMEI